MVLDIATDCEMTNQSGGDQEGQTRLSRMLAALESGELAERIIAAAQLAVAEHLLKNAQAHSSTVEPEDSVT
jgi:hypothetical protein